MVDSHGAGGNANGKLDGINPEDSEEQPTSDGPNGQLPMYHDGKRVRIKQDGESGRSGFHPVHFFRVCCRSSCSVSMIVNILWPVVPAAIAVHFAIPEMHLTIFILNYIAMVPAANLIGFAGQELARKLPKVFGVILETTLGSLVEIVLFLVLVVKGGSNIRVVKAAILGSILANMLLCLGICFIAGGIRHSEQQFAEAISEVGSGLMLVAGMGLVVPAAFASGLSPRTAEEAADVTSRVLKISRATAVVLLIAYIVYVFFQSSSHHSIFDSILEADEELDRDRAADLAKKKLTLVECIIALVLALTCVSLFAVFLVNEIPFVVEERGISDTFMGLILVPLVEKAAEHLTAVDEAWDNQANFALAHVLGASIQTALLNTPIVVLVGWGLGESMDLDFHPFISIVLVLAILVVGNFLRDGKSNYLEGMLCVFVYVIIAVCAFYFPNWAVETENSLSVDLVARGSV